MVFAFLLPPPSPPPTVLAVVGLLATVDVVVAPWIVFVVVF